MHPLLLCYPEQQQTPPNQAGHLHWHWPLRNTVLMSEKRSRLCVLAVNAHSLNVMSPNLDNGSSISCVGEETGVYEPPHSEVGQVDLAHIWFYWLKWNLRSGLKWWWRIFSLNIFQIFVILVRKAGQVTRPAIYIVSYNIAKLISWFLCRVRGGRNCTCKIKDGLPKEFEKRNHLL